MLAPSTTYSRFTNPAELKDWGYITTLRSIMPFQHTYHSLLRLLVPNGSLNAKQVSSNHVISATASGSTNIPITDAHFTNIFELNHGILIAGSNFGPAHTHGDKLIDGEALPDLQRWSDIAYLQALYLCSAENRVPEGCERPAADAVKKLKYVVRHDIENADTNVVIHELLQWYVTGPCSFSVSNEGCPWCSVYLMWPGLTFSIESDEGLALLGTPNGRGIAWLLKQHEELIGKRASKVTVWCDVEKVPLKSSMLFHLENAGVTEDELSSLSAEVDDLGT